MIARMVLDVVTVAILLIGAYYLAPLEGGNTRSITLRVAASLILVVVVAVWQVHAVSTAEFPQTRAVRALAVASLMLIVVFASGYLTLSQRDSFAFNEPLEHTGALYFTMSTLTTIGYGDIAADSDAARVAVMIQMVADVAVLGAAIRLIVGRARTRIGYPGARAPATDAGDPCGG